MVFSENGVRIIGYPHGKKEDKKGRREGEREGRRHILLHICAGRHVQECL